METLDNQKRDKLISQIIDRPETLTNSELAMFQNDEELRELYHTAVLCKDASMFNGSVCPDVEKELANFKSSRNKKRFMAGLHSIMRVAAAICGIIVLTTCVVAIVHPQFIRNFYFDDEIRQEKSSENTRSCAITAPRTALGDTKITNSMELRYNNIALDKIVEQLAEIYEVDYVFKNENAKSFRLYLEIEEGKTIEEVVEMLNNFGIFEASFNSGILIIG